MLSVTQQGPEIVATPHAQTAPSQQLAVLVVDDQASVRQGLEKLILAAFSPLREVVGAANSREALSLATAHQPGLVLLDVDLAGEDGLALLPDLCAHARVLVLTSHGDAATRARAQRLGASGLIEKHAPAAELIGALTRLLAPLHQTV